MRSGSSGWAVRVCQKQKAASRRALATRKPQVLTDDHVCVSAFAKP
ncbi:hypothetical protein GA0115246_113986 [Streptomyces sp. SolWspMP-sol7th]|nr:hypothetical protein GA0115246_113986 [Streptomyces sp. SolWspMP-sol7th]